jgi:hypothetical protein
MGCGSESGSTDAPTASDASADTPAPACTSTIAVSSGGKTAPKCPGAIAATTFLGALCTCRDANVQGYLRSRGFDSKKKPFDGKGDGGGAVGIDGRFRVDAAGGSAGYADIGGSFTVGATDPLTFAGMLAVAGDLRLSGKSTLMGYTPIARHASFGGDVTNAGFGTVEGDLRIDGSDALPLVVHGKRLGKTLPAPPPCDCDDLLDVSALVDAVNAANDDAKIGLDPHAFELVLGALETTLPCGVYAVTRVTSAGHVKLNVTAKVVLAIDGDFAPTGNFEIDLAPGASIDVLIRGKLLATGRAVFGRKENPAASRIWIAGDDDVTLTGAAEFVGNLYAPRSKVTATGYLDVWGSIFARDFIVPGYASFVYDRAVLEAGDDCGPTPPPTTCKRCGVCPGGTACVDGTCTTCKTDADCCGQQVCRAGRCEALLR